MGVFHSSQHETRARYASMEKGAGIALIMLSLAAVACFVLFQPGLWFILGSLLGGIVANWCWRAVLASRHELGVATAVAAVLLLLMAAVPEFARPLPAVVTIGLSCFGVGFYAAMLAMRSHKRKGGV